MPQKGRLLLVPTPLDFACDTSSPITDVLPEGTLRAASRTTHWIAENAKSARAFLKRVAENMPLASPLQAQQITELPRHVHKNGDHRLDFDARPLLHAALIGHDVGLLSEAGMPAVADPGSSVVRAAHDLGIQVLPLTGPASLLLALASSGLNGQNFAFVGYLPQDAAQRSARILQLERLALSTGQTQLWIETPYRNFAMVKALFEVLEPQTRLAIACGLTLESGHIHSLRVQAWKQAENAHRLPDNKTPAVYAIGP
jgi:16S rRNA (cytidine1402-2'-O)-methyltransferase